MKKKLDGRSKAARALKEKMLADMMLDAPDPAPEGGQGYNGYYKPIQYEASSERQEGGDHYLTLGIQPWDAMEAWMTAEAFKGFLRGNAIKYIARCDAKGGVEDLKKARHYLDKLIDQTSLYGD